MQPPIHRVAAWARRVAARLGVSHMIYSHGKYSHSKYRHGKHRHGKYRHGKYSQSKYGHSKYSTSGSHRVCTASEEAVAIATGAAIGPRHSSVTLET